MRTWTKAATLTLALLATAAPGAPAETIGARPSLGVEGMTQLDRLPVLGNPAQALGASSHARDGGNGDANPYLEQDAQGRYVLMEAAGPGAVTRLWMTGPASQGNGDATVFGHIQFFIDGEKTPRIDVPATALFKGDLAAFPAPLCHDYLVSSGGDYCDLRVPFAKSVRVVTTGAPAYYNVGYETYPAGTRVRSFDPADARTVSAVKRAARLWSRSGDDPQILSAGATHAGQATVAPGGRARLTRIDRAGTIRAIRIALDRHDDETLRSVRLQARWDGHAQPEVDAPLADLFLTGAGERAPARGLLAGYDPERHEGYLYFPMPFGRRAELELVNPTGQPVRATWTIEEAKDTYTGVGHGTGWFHATFNEDDATTMGRDYTLLDAAGSGKVVGVSFTEDGDSANNTTTFMEGDERVYVDGARSPAIYGTGTEDFFSGAYYYTGLFTLPDHGATAKEQITPVRARTAQYRLMLADPWEFRDGINAGIEHAAGDGQQTAIRSVVFWYGDGQRRLAQTTAFNVADGSRAGYSGAGTPSTLTAFFEGDRDGNVSPPPDWIIPGSVPVPAEVDPMDEAMTAGGLAHPAGSTVRFTLELDPANRGAILRRLLDQGTFGQRAEVLVDGKPAGVWLTPGDNQSKRWAESDFALPAALTRDKDHVAVELRVLPAVDAPSGASTGWTDFRYTAFSVLP